MASYRYVRGPVRTLPDDVPAVGGPGGLWLRWQPAHARLVAPAASLETLPSAPAEGPPPATPGVETVLRGPRGPYLLGGGAKEATQRAQLLADRLGVPLTTVRADSVSIEADTVAAMTLHLRDALWLRFRRLERVYEGRILALGTRTRGDAAGRMPAGAIDLTLATDEDRRSLQLTGGFARAFLGSGAQEGDIVQIAKDQAIVSLRRDRRESIGRVLDERDFVYRIRLGDRDRAWAPGPAGEGTPTLSAPPRSLYGTGRRALPPLEALRATDAWVDAERADRDVHLEPGVLILLDAGPLDARVLALLREAVASGTAPILLLHDPDPAASERWRRFFPEAAALPLG